MPKVELHVHLEGSIRPETVLKLAQRNNVTLPADTVEGLHGWYKFRDFPHFVDVYVSVSKTIKTADDVELIAREFLDGQKAQNILHSEITYTASTIEKYNGIPWPDQLEALKRAREYGEVELGVTCCFILDIVRGDAPERGLEVAQWAVAAKDKGVCALGLAGEEGRVKSSHYQEAYGYALSNGLPIIPHAGETQGAWSVAECLSDTKANRIGHGVRCLEDPEVVQSLKDQDVTLEVCPSSNICLNVCSSLQQHVLPELMKQGLKVTINSDDPPMFGTTLTDELIQVADTFNLSLVDLKQLQLNAVEASLMAEDRRAFIRGEIDEFFATEAK
jgi:adenosine deaminase